jgi:hypothetical protein
LANNLSDDAENKLLDHLLGKTSAPGDQFRMAIAAFVAMLT